MISLPVSTDANQEFNISLDGQQIVISLRWQDVGKSWFISLSNSQSGEIYTISKRLCPNILLFGIKLTDFIGDIIPFNESAPYSNIERDSFQNGYLLCYVTQEEKEKLLEQYSV